MLTTDFDLHGQGKGPPMCPRAAWRLEFAEPNQLISLSALSVSRKNSAALFPIRFFEFREISFDNFLRDRIAQPVEGFGFTSDHGQPPSDCRIIVAVPPQRA